MFSAVVEELIPYEDKDQIADLEQINEDEEIDEILRMLMPILPSFSGKNFDLWKMKMKGLLGLVDLWEFVQNGYEDPTKKRRDKLTLYLVSSTLNNGILSALLYEFGEIENAKIFWDILEMKYSEKGINTLQHISAFEETYVCETELSQIVVNELNDEHETNASEYEETSEIDREDVEFHCAQSHVNNDDYVEGFVIETKMENESFDYKSESLVEEDLFEAETYEVSFDEDNSSHEEWSNLMHEKHLIDELLFGEKSGSLACTNQVEDNFIVAEKGDKEEKNQKVLLEEQNEKSKNCIDILMNVFECAGFTKEECDVKHLVEVRDKFDEELKWLQKPYCDECKETLEYDEDCMDTEEEEDCITNIEIESFFMKWSPEEMKYYYELMLQESLEQDIDDCTQKEKQQSTYENFVESASIKDELIFQELEAMLKTKTISQKSRLKKKSYTRMTMEQKTRVKVFQVWSRKRKKKDKHHTTTKKAKMKGELMNQLLKLCCNDVKPS